MQRPAPPAGLASKTQSHATQLQSIQPQRHSTVAALEGSSKQHQCGSLTCPSAQLIQSSVLKQKMRKALERAEEEWRAKPTISLVPTFSSKSLHYSINYFHFTCRLIWPGLVSSDSDDRSLGLCRIPWHSTSQYKTFVRGRGSGTTAWDWQSRSVNRSNPGMWISFCGLIKLSSFHWQHWHLTNILFQTYYTALGK